MNILVTGGLGFIGSHLSIFLTKKYPFYNIIVLDKLDYSSNQKNISEISSARNFKFYHGNILNFELLDSIFLNEKIDVVLHLAAYTHVDHSFSNSIRFTENNVMGTNVILECSKKHNVKRFIYVSTDEVYGCEMISDKEQQQQNANGGACEKLTRIQPTNPYSASKAAAELLVQAYQRSFGLPTIITRGNNVYGPFQYPEKIIPKFITLLSSGQACTIHGSGKNMRSFIYVSDMVDAFDIILHKGVIGEIYNIGTDFEISNLNLTKKLLEMFQSRNPEKPFDSLSLIKFVQDRPFNDYRYNLNFEKLKQLGWRQNITWEEGLEKTLNWYLANINYWDKTILPSNDTTTNNHPNGLSFICHSEG
ncbi:putative dTDP-D-glucose 4 [Tieghemostelium lacteum]|uniref:Putative dTDP-D-glucose 4 n=1 Tax=Tieghemostelium lacteum TaxID=361077 RepID=A0A151ZA61_TIELA|nr:putative dTDP-D-glucose 4 [Tieghemostelium lacteum]|eukprot:KYQ90828.1 putative dTDP-D-glucose 4 [Tieghemostelium lacteum]